MSSDLIPCATCQVCQAPLPSPVLDLGLQPMCDDLVPVGQDRQSVRYPIQISLCPVCLTAHQAFNIRKETLFPKEYHYRPRFTQDVLDGMKQLVADCIDKFGAVTDKLVCDVGCNDGSLLNFFRAQGARTGGIEPTNAALEAVAAGHNIINDYFSPESAGKFVEKFGQPDFVTFTNVFAHIEDLGDAIAALKVLIKAGTIVVIENHYLGTVLSTNQFDTFYHEHPRTYSLRSFEQIARNLGGQIVSFNFPKRYGGNIRTFITGSAGPQSSGAAVMPDLDESGFPGKLFEMQGFVENWKTETLAQLKKLADAGVTVSGKSFPGRASILISLLDIDVAQHPVVYEKSGSLKIGHYVPGTRIPIASDERWISGQDKPEAMLIWGWHIAPEIAAYLRASGYRGRIFSPLPAFTEL